MISPFSEETGVILVSPLYSKELLLIQGTAPN